MHSKHLHMEKMWSTLLGAKDKKIKLKDAALTLEGLKFIVGVGQNLYTQKINNSGAKHALRVKWEVQTVTPKRLSAVCLWELCFGLSL